VAHGELAEALQSFRQGLTVIEALLAEDGGNAEWQSDREFSIGRIGSMAYRLVAARDFAVALEAADEAISRADQAVWLYTNRAHALMFLGRVDEARTLYLRHRDETDVQDGKSWEAVILADFADLRKAGLSHPLMDELEKQFSAPGVAQQANPAPAVPTGAGAE
jgi:hypothetical protein